MKNEITREQLIINKNIIYNEYIQARYEHICGKCKCSIVTKSRGNEKCLFVLLVSEQEKYLQTIISKMKTNNK